MKKVFLTLAAAALLTLSSAAFAADAPTDGSNAVKPEARQEEAKKKPTPEEIAAYQKQVEEASVRDHDLIKVFVENSILNTCYPPTEKYYRWLVENKDVVVDQKEVLAPSHYIWSKDKSGCTVIMVVHYHKEK